MKFVPVLDVCMGNNAGSKTWCDDHENVRRPVQIPVINWTLRFSRLTRFLWAVAWYVGPGWGNSCRANWRRGVVPLDEWGLGVG